MQLQTPSPPKDILVSFRHPDYGFYIRYPQQYQVKVDWRGNSRIRLLKDSTSVLEAVVERIPSDFWSINDSFKNNPDTLLFYAIERSGVRFYSDGPFSSAFPRFDSVKTYTTSKERRAFIIYQTYIEERWEQIDEQHPAHRETPLGPVYWVDISKGIQKVLLEVRNPDWEPYSPQYTNFISSFADLVFVP